MPTPDVRKLARSNSRSSRRESAPPGGQLNDLPQASLQSGVSHRSTGIAFAASVLFAALAAATTDFAVYAAGLEKIRVLSNLGQPLRAEIDLTSAGEDADSMSVRLASPDAFSKANIDYSASLSTLRFTLDRRANGQPFLRVTSTKPINDPFVDMLVELNWSSGRLVRQYTFLLDPPDMRPASPSPAEATGATVRVAPRAAAPSQPPSGFTPSESAGRRGQPDSRAAGLGQEYRVRRGDTALKIARTNKPAAVSVDQMLIALFRNNPKAFDGQNINRLRAGAVIRIPDSPTAGAVGPGEARRLLSAQMSDFAAYRASVAKTIAQAPAAAQEETKQAASGKVSAAVDEPATLPSASQDQVKLSKLGEKEKPGAAASAAAAPSAAKPAGAALAPTEDAAARERMLQEANTRVSLLEKNVADLEKLLQLKNQNLADLQKQAQAKTSETASRGLGGAPAVSPAAGTAPVAEISGGKPPQAAAAPDRTADTKRAREPGFINDLLANPLALYGLGGILLALILYAFYQMRRKDKFGKFEDSFLGGNNGLRANSLFGMTGGQSVDTSNSSFHSNFLPPAGQSEANEVDPIAEAEVYIAYGRDAQAEEILKEALRTQPDRQGVRLKLLEIYAKRQDAKSFETVANELYAATNGQGEDWKQAAALGHTLDPANPIYRDRSEETSSSIAKFEPISIPPAAPKKEVPPSPASFTGTITAPQPARPAFPPAAPPATPTPPRDTVQKRYAGPIQLEPVLDMNLVKTEPYAAGASEFANFGVRPPSHEMDLDVGFGSEVSRPRSEVFPPESEVSHSESEVFPPESEVSRPGSEVFPPADSTPAEGKRRPGDDWAERSSVDFRFDLDAEGQTTEPFAYTDRVPDPVPGRPAGMTPTPIGNLVETAYAARPNPVQQEIADSDLISSSYAPEAEKQGDTDTDFGPFTSPTNTIVLGSRKKMPDVDLDLKQDANKQAGSAPAAASTGKPSNWQEMATKIDLALACRDIGDKEGARELLREVVHGGDAVQIRKAKELLTSMN